MKTMVTSGVMVLAWAFAAGAEEPAVRGTPNDYKFDADTPGKPPVGFTFARTKNLGTPGKWVVEAQKDAPSKPNVLGQLDNDDTSARYPMAITAPVFHSDVRVSV